METFEGLKLAYESGKKGGSMPTVFNAANEKAVAMFLDKKIKFLDEANKRFSGTSKKNSKANTRNSKTTASKDGKTDEKAKKTKNVLCNIMNDYVAEGRYNVSWEFNYTPNVDAWRATVVTALTKYSVDPSDANWADVVSAFVDGWAIEYTMANG